MGAMIPGLEGMDFSIYIDQIMNWIIIIFTSSFCLSVLYGLYHVLSFKISATVFPLFGSGQDGVFSFGKAKGNRIKWVNKKTAWRSLWPLFNRIDREPFDSEFIYPGNKVYVFELGDEWSPGRVNIDLKEEEIRAEINPVPFVVRNWQSLTHKKNAAEFAQHNFWEDNKYFIMGVVAVLMCCILCGVTVYFTYKFAAGGVQQAASLTNALKNFGSIAGK